MSFEISYGSSARDIDKVRERKSTKPSNHKMSLDKGEKLQHLLTYLKKNRRYQPKLDLEIIKKIDSFVDAYFDEMREKYKGIPAIDDKFKHIENVVKIVEIMEPGNEQLKLAAKIHDIGRFLQYELLKQFNDGKMMHHITGEHILSQALFKKLIPNSAELDALRLVVTYHGRIGCMPYVENIPDRTKELIDKISRADDIENGCIGAIGYLEREVKEDAKGYKVNNPDLDMKKVSSDVLKFFLNGEKFDKMKYCKTYADYILFAAVLAVQACKKDTEIAKKAMNMPNYGYSSAFEGYKDIFNKFVEKEHADTCYTALVKHCS